MSQNHLPPEGVKKFLSQSGTVRVSVLVAKHLLAELQSVHPHMSPVASVALSRTVISACLLGAQAKDGKTGLHFQGNGPLGEIFVEASFEGKVRGYVANPQVNLALKNGKLDVSAAIGVGLLNVVRSLPYQKQAFNGTVIIKTGEIGADIAFYLQQSHQIPSVVAVGEHINEYGLLTTAGGIIVELMPGHTEEEVKVLEKNVAAARSLSAMLQAGATEAEIADEYLRGIVMSELEHPYSLSYSCTCSQDKVDRSLLFLEAGEILDMIQSQKPAEVKCEFCSREYQVSVDRLSEIYQELKKKAMH